jgi:hypothetical protein
MHVDPTIDTNRHTYRHTVPPPPPNESKKPKPNPKQEVKAALSSELEGEIVKATRPDDRQIKLKHLEPLLAITYQTPAQLDPFPPILRSALPLFSLRA